jgi:threonine dehydrogenase-like Zn-dependent dehydrogenase
VRAFVITGPRAASVVSVPPPVAGRGQVVVDVERAGVCGTDMEFYSGEMTYLRSGEAAYPIRIGHEWCGTVSSVGADVDPAWLGRRVTGDTMLGCGACPRCLGGRQHLCADRYEVGIRGGWPGALAEQVLMPARALHRLPPSVDATAGALVEPGANALRAVSAAGLGPGDRLLVVGPGTIGLLVALIARAGGAGVDLLGVDAGSLEFARSLGFASVWTAGAPPPAGFDAVVDASTGPGVPALALDLAEPGKRVVYIGLSEPPSMVDTRTIVLRDLTVTGVLSGSGGLTGTIERYASGAVDPRPLVAATVGLDAVADVLAGTRRRDWSPAPKVLVDPRR